MRLHSVYTLWQCASTLSLFCSLSASELPYEAESAKIRQLLFIILLPGNMRLCHRAYSIHLLRCVAVVFLGIQVDAYAIPFSFSNSAEIVNKVCLHPCREIGLEKGTRVTVDLTLSNANSGAEGDCISLLTNFICLTGFHQRFRNLFFSSYSH